MIKQIRHLNPSKIFKKMHEPIVYKPELFGLDNNLTGKGVNISIIGSGVSPNFYIKKIGGFDVLVDNVSNPDDNINLSTIVSSFIGSKNKDGITGISNNAVLNFTKSINNEGIYNSNSISGSLLWSIIKNVNIICVPLDIDFKTDQVDNTIKKANETDIIILHKYNVETRKIDKNGTFSVNYDSNIKKYKISVKDNVINISFPDKPIYSNYGSKSYIEIDGELASLGIATGIVTLLFEKNKIRLADDLILNSQKKIETKASFGGILGTSF